MGQGEDDLYGKSEERLIKRIVLFPAISHDRRHTPSVSKVATNCREGDSHEVAIGNLSIAGNSGLFRARSFLADVPDRPKLRGLVPERLTSNGRSPVLQFLYPSFSSSPCMPLQCPADVTFVTFFVSPCALDCCNRKIDIAAPLNQT